MNHGIRQSSLNRRSQHRLAMFANMAAALVKHEQITTTLVKAKALRPFTEKLITLAKHADADPKKSLAKRRQAMSIMRDEAQVKKLFDVLGPRYKDREGGYIRIMKAGFRFGDAAPIAVIEFVDRDITAKGQDSGPTMLTEDTASEHEVGEDGELKTAKKKPTVRKTAKTGGVSKTGKSGGGKATTRKASQRGK